MKNKKTLFIILVSVVIVAALGVCLKFYMDQKKQKEEIVGILMRTSSDATIYLNEMLEGEGRYGEKYYKLKDSDKFKDDVYKAVEEFLSEHTNSDSYDLVVEKLAVVKSEGLLNAEAEKLINDYETAAVTERAAYLMDDLNNGEYENAARTLAWLMERDAVESSGVDMDAVINHLLENCKVYSVKNNVGAYYDDVELKSSSSRRDEGVSWMDPIGYTSTSYAEKSYGDFCVGTSRSTTHYEALEGFDFEDKYNTTTSGTTLYLRGREVNGHFWPDTLEYASKNGAEYLICSENSSDSEEVNLDGILFLGNDKLYAMAYNGSTVGDYIGLEGDFSAYTQEAKKLYDEKYSAQTELETVAEFMNKKQYEEAMNILQYYAHVDGALEEIYTIAVESVKAGNTEFGLRCLEYIPYFEMIAGLDMDYMFEHLDGRFDPDVNVQDYTKPFMKLMMDVVGEMTDDEIVNALSGKTFKEIPKGIYEFRADGTGTAKYSNTGFTWEIKWSVSDGKITIENPEVPNEIRTYSVYNVQSDYYLLAYTTEHSSSIFMKLLKVR